MYRGSVAAGFELHWYKLYIQPCRICLMVDWELDASNKKILIKIPCVKPNRKVDIFISRIFKSERPCINIFVNAFTLLTIYHL